MGIFSRLKRSAEAPNLSEAQGTSRDEVIAAFMDILRRPPESEATIAARMAHHPSAEHLRNELRESDEFKLIHAPWPGKRISIEEIDAEIELHRRDYLSETLAAMNAFWADIPSCNLSPDAPEYRAWVLDTYKRIADRDYELQAEQFTLINPDLPFPYDTQNARVVGDQLMSIGYVIQAMGLPPRSSVLEMGFGWGNTVIQMARMGYDVSGIDVNPRYIDLVSRQAKALGVDVNLRVGEFFDIERTEEKFDAILFFEAFHHCDDHVRLLEAIPDRLNKGGKLVLAGETINNSLPYPWGVNPAGQAIYCIKEFGWLELSYREDYLLPLLDKMGWNVVKHAFPLSATGITYVATRRE